jgi:hypothetical protein
MKSKMKMKNLLFTILALSAVLIFTVSFTGCDKNSDSTQAMNHDHSGHDHSAHSDQPKQKTYVNTACPIMGSPLPATVSAGLTRTYKGQAVAFCCPGCPEKWDSLSDEQKQAKLDNVKK